MSDLSTSASPAAPAGQVPAEAPARPSLGGWAALLVVYVVWGSTYLAIRVGVETIPPLLLAGARYLIAGLILFPFAIRSGSAAIRAADRPSRANWLACAVVGILLLLGGNGLVSVGERTVPSGFASLLVATVPLWLLVLDAVLSRRRIGWLPLAGLIVGLAGVALLAGLATARPPAERRPAGSSSSWWRACRGRWAPSPPPGWRYPSGRRLRRPCRCSPAA